MRGRSTPAIRTTANERAVDDACRREPFVYLASQSPRRRQLLEQIGVRHELLVAGDDEDVEALEATRAGELPARYVERVTRAKLAAASARLAARGLAPAPILCADTAVALGTRILGKPRDAGDAAATLALLSGRTHRVLSAVARRRARPLQLRLSVSRVRFAPSTPGASRATSRRRAVRQSGRVRDPGRGGELGRADRRQLHRYHGIAVARDGRAARVGRRRCPAVSSTPTPAVRARCKTS